MALAGYATAEGTRRYAQRFASQAAPGHFRERRSLNLSSLGIGTYLGEPDVATDEQYVRAVSRVLELGLNVVDTAINYRFQRSERSIGSALAELTAAGKLARDEVVVSTKAGFLTPDGEYPPDPTAYFTREYIQPGILRVEDVVGGMHCLAPSYLENQLGRSLSNLGLETVDIFYLHNPETQLQAVPRPEFFARLLAAFEKLEALVAAGKLRWYGAATWDGFRRRPDARDYLSLQEMVKLAAEVGGEGHHFHAVQLPYNLAMPEAYYFANQEVSGEAVPLLAAAEKLGVTVFASASILQGQVARALPAELRALFGGNLESDAQCALQFVRSTPGLGTALVGMRQLGHVEENARLVGKLLAPPEKFHELASLE